MFYAFMIIPNLQIPIIGGFTLQLMHHGIITEGIPIQLDTKPWLESEKLLAAAGAINIKLFFVFYENNLIVFYVKCKSIARVVCVLF